MWKNIKDEKPIDHKIVPVWARTSIGDRKMYGFLVNGKWYHVDHCPMPWEVLKWFDVPDPEKGEKGEKDF